VVSMHGNMTDSVESNRLELGFKNDFNDIANRECSAGHRKLPQSLSVKVKKSQKLKKNSALKKLYNYQLERQKNDEKLMYKKPPREIKEKNKENRNRHTNLQYIRL
jgi:hypothetical protein